MAALDEMPFGKHRGLAWGEIPADYLQWLVATPLDHRLGREVKDAAREELSRREAAEEQARRAREGWARDFRHGYRGARAGEDRDPGGRGGSGRDPAALSGELRPWALRIVRAGYRALAKEHHPDVGGATDDMKALNAAEDALKRLLGSG